MGGIGKSTLAAQIAARVSRLQSERVITVVNGEVLASVPWPAEADFVILDNFDDNLSQESGRWTVRDPALAALLAGWTGKLLITCRHPFSLGEASQGRIVAPDGTAAYRRALAADIRPRQAAGAQLLRAPRITVTPSARSALAAGQVDARLLITLAALAASEPVRIDGFGGRGRGESPGLALRTAEITAPAATARRMLAFVRAQRSPYLAIRADLTPAPDGYVLTVEFGAPAPLGMLR